MKTVKSAKKAIKHKADKKHSSKAIKSYLVKVTSEEINSIRPSVYKYFLP